MFKFGKIALLVFVLSLFVIPASVQAVSVQPANTSTVHNISLQASNNSSYSGFINMLNRIKIVVIAGGAIIATIMWVWEGIFMLMHRDDKEGILRFKHDLIYLVIATIIILGATLIVGLIGWMVSGT